MAQGYSVPLHMEHLARDMGLTQVGPGAFVETFIGPTLRKNFEDMDRRKREVEAKIKGATVTHRTKIGRNTSCPCGSGVKFKKCCIGKARFTG